LRNEERGFSFLILSASFGLYFSGSLAWEGLFPVLSVFELFKEIVILPIDIYQQPKQK
jgi:hypothetical protein